MSNPDLRLDPSDLIDYSSDVLDLWRRGPLAQEFLPPQRATQASEWVWALSGGGARGAFQAGASLYLISRDTRFRPSGIAACSVGSVNALAAAEGDDEGAEKLKNAWCLLQNRNDMYAWDDWINDLNEELDPLGISGRDFLASIFGNQSFSMPDTGTLLNLDRTLYQVFSSSGDSAGQTMALAVGNVLGAGIPALVMLDQVSDGASDLMDRLGRAVEIVKGTTGGLFNFTPLRRRIETEVDVEKLQRSGIPIRFIAVRIANGLLYDFSARFVPYDDTDDWGRTYSGFALEVEVLEVGEDEQQQRTTKAVGECFRGDSTARPLIELALASSSIPLTNPPLDLNISYRSQDESHPALETVAFVDGGVRDILPVESAVEMFGRELSDHAEHTGVVSIVCGDSYVRPEHYLFPQLDPNPPRYDRNSHARARQPLPEVAMRALTYAVDEVLTNERRLASGCLPEELDSLTIAPSVPVGDSKSIDPGLVQIQLSYGWMTAFDAVKRYLGEADEDDHAELWLSTNTIIQARLLAWQLERHGSSLIGLSDRMHTVGEAGGDDADWAFATLPPALTPRLGDGLPLRLIKSLILETVSNRVRRFGLESIPDIHDLSNFQIGNINCVADWWQRWERHAMDPDTGKPTGPGLHINRSSGTGWDRIVSNPDFEPIALGRPATTPWDSALWLSAASLGAADPQTPPTSPFEHSPDYCVVRQEGFVLDEDFAAETQTEALRRVWDSTTQDNRLLHPAEPTPAADHPTQRAIDEGRIFAPAQPQPDGTVPLYRWHSSRHNDYMASADPRFVTGNQYYDPQPRAVVEGTYRDPKLLGYIFPPSRSLQTALLPLWRWFSPSRMDNDTKTGWAFSVDGG